MTGTDSWSPTPATNATADAGAVNWVLIALQSFLNGPAKAINAGCDCVVRYSGFFAPLRQCQSNSVESYMPVVGSVILLLFLSGPAAIFRFIAPRVFNPVYSVQRGRARSHILQEKLVVAPAFADSHTLVFRLPVTLSKPRPNGIGARFLAAPRLSVDRALLVSRHNFGGVISLFLEAHAVQIFRQTAARSCVAKNKAASWCGDYIAAIASALPRAVMLSVHS